MKRAGFLMLVTGVMLAGALVIPSGNARAIEFDSGASPGVDEGEVVDDDLMLTGGTIDVDGEVTRDLFIFGGNVTINGDVGGSVHVSSGTVEINGDVGESVRVASGRVTISGDVGWDVVAAGGSLTIEPDANIENDLVAGSGSMTVDGNVGRDIRGDTGSLDLGGSVGGDVRVSLDNELNVQEDAVIEGDVRYESSQEADIHDDAQVNGEVVFDERGGEGFVDGFVGWFGSLMLRLGWAVVAGTALVLLLPGQSTGTAIRLRNHPIASLLWGAGAFIAIPALAILLLMTIIGIPTSLFLIAATVTLLYLSQIVVGLTLARMLMPASWLADPSRWRLWVMMVLGVTIVVLVRLLPIPFGWTLWTSLLIGLLAFGAVWIYLTGLGVGACERENSSAVAADGN